jgi:hypothetical protein
MKKIFLFLAFLILFYPAKSFAPIAVSISPPKMEFTTKAGKKVKDLIEVKNQDIVPVNLKVYAAGFSIGDDGGLNYSSKKSYSAEDWIRLVPDTLSIKPDDYNVVRYEIQVPEGTPNGSYTASIQIEEVKDEPVGLQRAQMQIKGRLAFIIYVNVGKPAYSGTIESFDVSLDQSNIKFRVRLRNDGNYYIRPQGKIIIEKDGAKVKEVPYPNLPLLARQARTTEVAIPRDLGSGSFKAVVSLDIGASKTLDAATNFSL